MEECQARSGEQLLRDPDDIKRHWYKKLCNKGMKPTGSSGVLNDRIHVCQEIQNLIHSKYSAVVANTDDDDWGEERSCGEEEKRRRDDDVDADAY